MTTNASDAAVTVGTLVALDPEVLAAHALWMEAKRGRNLCAGGPEFGRKAEEAAAAKFRETVNRVRYRIETEEWAKVRSILDAS